MPYTNRWFLVEVVTSTSGSMHTQIVNFHIVMEIDWDNVGTYLSTVSLTNQKVSFCGSSMIEY